MGAVQSAPGPVHVTIVMPSKGNKLLKSKFTKDPPASNHNVQEYFVDKLKPLLNNADKVGALLRATVVVLQGGKDEIEVDELTDEAMLYVQMGISRATFYVEHADNGNDPGPSQDVLGTLVREPMVELPTWSHAGRAAMTKLHVELRSMLKNDGLGFRGSVDLRIGGDWMLGLVESLYKLSPFHEKLKARGCAMPKRFAFSAGADDFKKKGKAVPTLTQEILQQVWPACKCTHA